MISAPALAISRYLARKLEFAKGVAAAS